MKIGCPTEVKPQEYRVGLTPDAARELVAHGHAVLVQEGAGTGAGACATGAGRFAGLRGRTAGRGGGVTGWSVTITGFGL